MVCMIRLGVKFWLNECHIILHSDSHGGTFDVHFSSVWSPSSSPAHGGGVDQSCVAQNPPELFVPVFISGGSACLHQILGHRTAGNCEQLTFHTQSKLIKWRLLFGPVCQVSTLWPSPAQSNEWIVYQDAAVPSPNITITSDIKRWMWLVTVKVWNIQNKSPNEISTIVDPVFNHLFDIYLISYHRIKLRRTLIRK